MAGTDSIRLGEKGVPVFATPVVIPLPTATNTPVRQTRTRGRLPVSIGSLKQARKTRLKSDRERSEVRACSLREEVARAVDSSEFDASERRILASALAVVEGKLRKGGCLFDSQLAVRSYLTLQLGGKPHEEFGAMFLDSQNRLIEFEVMFRGTLSSVATYPRELLLRALAHRASAVILVHNHPSGDARPSRADESMTAAIKATLALADIRCLDHFIVTAETSVSMAAMGLV